MSRVIDVTVPSQVTDRLVQELRDRDDVLSLRVQRGISLQPPGDIVTISSTNQSMHAIVRMLDGYGIGADERTSLSASEPVSLLVPSARELLAGDSSEGTWEELEMVIARESNTTGNTLFVMAVSGALAAIGLATNALHVVVAAMLIAPGFEPLIRIPMGIVARSNAWRRGINQTLQAYGALLVGAAATAALLDLLGTSPLGDEKTSYLSPSVLVTYWTTFSPASIIASATAGAAGAVLVAAKRSVLTGGVMIALALVPSATLVAVGLVAWDVDIVGKGALRWAVEVALVMATSLLVFLWKRARTYKRDSML